MSNFRRFLMIKNEDIEPVQTCCVYTTTEASQNVKLISSQECANKITLEDGTDIPITGTGALSYTFAEAGDHKVTIEFKEDVTNFDYCFSGCTTLTSIPDNLFASNTAVTSFGNCFRGCSGLTSIPANLFENNTAVTNFSSCFWGCSGLTSIPSDLFANNTAVTYFTYCFRDCKGLTSIPSNLFASNTAVTDFRYCFYKCSGLTGNVPVDNDATPIYNRSGSGKSGYAKVISYSYCFYDCTGLTDYSSIPSGWK